MSLKILNRQFRALMNIEQTLSPAQRKLNQFQLLATEGLITYIVGKGGANTIFYSVNQGERKLCYPDEMLAILKEWTSTVTCAVFRNDKRISKPTTDVKRILAVTNAKYLRCTINELSGDGSKGRTLYTCKSTLMEPVKWIKNESRKTT